MYNVDHVYLESVDDGAPWADQLALSGILRGPREHVDRGVGHVDWIQVGMG